MFTNSSPIDFVCPICEAEFEGFTKVWEKGNERGRLSFKFQCGQYIRCYSSVWAEAREAFPYIRDDTRLNQITPFYNDDIHNNLRKNKNVKLKTQMTYGDLYNVWKTIGYL